MGWNVLTMSRPGPSSVPPKPITDVFTWSDTAIDRSKCVRTVPMKVLALGLGRTGTVSMREALKRLGYEDTYHMMSASVENPPDCLMWQQAFDAKYDGIGTFGRKEWDSLLGHCQAVCDWPAICFSKELIETYPEAKVILTTRDLDKWHASVMKTVYWRAKDPELKLASYVDWGAGLYYRMLTRFFTTFFEDDFPGKGKDVFKAHYKELRSLVPKDNLLEFNVSQGWEPLCAFLGVPVPLGEPFPHSNDADSFVKRCQARNRRQLGNAVFRYMLYAVFLSIGYKGVAYLYQIR